MAAVFPAAAQAVPPDNDDYLSAAFVNDPGTGLLGTGPARNEYVDIFSTAEATTEAEIYSGQAEATRCPTGNANQWAAYGKTVWYDVHPDVNGVLRIRSAGFDSVIGLVQYTSPDDASVISWTCRDDPDSPTDEEDFVTVYAGAHYSIQVGGYAGYVTNLNDPDPFTPASGTLTFRLNFLPNQDLDDLYDSDDRCPTSVGPAALRGCPDTDSDNIPDIDDECDRSGGRSAQGGCPDSDGDGIRDFSDARGIEDQCRLENASARDVKKNGCLDYGILGSKTPYDFNNKYRGSKLLGIVFSRIKVTGLPANTKVVLSCQPKKRCKKKTGTVSGTRSYLAHKLVKIGTTVSLRLTKSGYVGRLFKFKITSHRVRHRSYKAGKVKKSTLCIPGAGGSARSCKTVSTDR